MELEARRSTAPIAPFDEPPLVGGHVFEAADLSARVLDRRGPA